VKKDPNQPREPTAVEHARLGKTSRILLALFVYIATAPARWLFSAYARTHSLLRIQITFGWGRASIISQCKSQEQELTYLMVAYLLFLSKYFYICDKRQLGPVSDLVAKYARESAPPDQLASVLLETVRASFDKIENAAFADQFKYPKLPPIFVEHEPATDRIDRIELIGRYAVTIFKRGGRWLDDLQVSRGFDIVLLPITVGILYQYVTDRIGAQNRTLLDTCISELITEQAFSNGRFLRDATRIANAVIAKNLET
jgi:hypothetical protein